MEGFIRTLAITIMLLTVTGAAHAAEINAFISTAIKAVTDELLPRFEHANGHAIRASYGPSGALIPRFERGEPVDIFLTDRSAIDALIKQGKVVDAPASALPCARAHPTPMFRLPRRSSARCSRRRQWVTPHPRAAASRRRISRECSSASGSHRK